MRKRLFFILAMIPSFLAAQNVVINEIMASNRTILFDEDGDASDWIELYNKGTEAINLAGFGLSDDTLDTQKWAFGSATIEPGKYKLVFASGKDRKSVSSHTNFKISASGESIVLSDAGGVVLDRVDVPASATDVSWARLTDGSPTWVFQSASPKSANTGEEFPSFADAVSFSPPGGFYPSAVSVELSASNSRIFYTLDGSVPDSSSTKYSTPINISETTVLKTVSYKAHHLTTRPVTRTYFINESTDLPVISLSADPDDLFGAAAGIYTNFTQDWERPAHVEFFEDDKRPGFSEDCGINIVGNQSANWAQKSIAVKFTKDYGVTNIDYPLFPGFWVKTFDSFILRNSGNDWQYTHMRDALMQTLVKDLDIDYQEYRPAVTFINGEYWGIYNIREKINEHYVENRYGADPDNIDMLEDRMTVLSGDSLHYRRLIDFMSTQDMTSSAAFDTLDAMVDLDECILYFAAQAYYDNMDWPGTNIKFWRERSETGKWRWILFGLDFGFGLYAHGPSEDHVQFMFSTFETRYSNPPWATLFQRKLVENPTIKSRFINQIADLLNTNFKSDRVVGIINDMAGHIANEIPRHRARWPQAAGENVATKMIPFAQDRPAYLRTHVRSYFRCGYDGKLTLNASPGGRIRLNTLYLKQADMPWTGTYFQGNAVQLKAIPDPGYKFDGWSGAVTSGEASVSLRVTIASTVAATFSPDSTLAKDVVINEINYHSSDSFDTGDWIELYNQSGKAVNLGGWVFADGDPNHVYTFPAGTELGPNQYLVLAEQDSAFMSRFPDVSNHVGRLDFGLNNAGESIKLMDEDGQLIDSLAYDDASPWPAADGSGATMELSDPASDNSNASNWSASLAHGTPGKVNSIMSSVSEREGNTIPQTFRLFQNYPNPFNPTTRIVYQIPRPCHVTLSIFNTSGQLIETLVSENQSPGEYSTTWKAKGYGSGIYFYRLAAGDHVFIRKMLFLK